MKVLITGASGDIGRAIAEKFLTEGHEVVGLDVRPSALQRAGYRHILADVRGELPPEDGVNVLVTAAGVQFPAEEVIDVNLKGVIRTMERYAFTPAIRAVVNVASASARNGSEFPEYVASKAGVVAYTKNAALRLAAYGAVCNSLSPGGVYTSSNAPVLDDETLRAAAIGESLLGKWAEPQEIAEWAYFLAVTNKSMTGEDVLVDNGEMLKSKFVWPEKGRG
ncbi:MAG: SDR family oxidoreductase [Clostridia bacterium]|nr:SDR family oxidoreductase [Clostridia bacterium]